MRFTDCIDITGESCKKFEGKKVYISTGAVDVDHVDLNQIETVNYDTKPSRANLITDDNSILFAKMQGTKKVLFIDKGLEKKLYSTGFFSVSPKKNILNKKCLYHLLGSKTFLSQKDKYCSGATQKSITLEGLNKIEITIPNLEDQDKIVKILDSIKVIIESYKKEIKKYDALIKARFIEMFGDPIDNSREYPVHQLSEYIMSLTSGSRGWAQYCVDDGEEWFITIKNVNNCHISIDNMQPVNAPVNAEAKRTKVHEGDLLISITADLGRTGVVTKKIAEHGAYINQHLSCIRLNRDALNPLFVAHYMESPAGKEQFIAKNQSAVKAGLNFNSINSLKIMVPPLAEQNRFIDFVQQVDKSRFDIKKSITELEREVVYD